MNFNQMVAEALKSEECRDVLLNILEDNGIGESKEDIIKYGKENKYTPVSMLVTDKSGITDTVYLVMSGYDKVKLQKEFIEYIKSEMPAEYKRIEADISKISVKLTRWNYQDIYDAFGNGTFDYEVSKEYSMKNKPRNNMGKYIPVDVVLQSYVDDKYPNRHQIIYLPKSRKRRTTK